MKPWKIWLRGLVAAAISGAGSGLTGYYMGVSGKKLMVMVGVHAVMTVGAYLYQSPLPGMSNNTAQAAGQSVQMPSNPNAQ